MIQFDISDWISCLLTMKGRRDGIGQKQSAFFLQFHGNLLKTFLQGINPQLLSNYCDIFCLYTIAKHLLDQCMALCCMLQHCGVRKPKKAEISLRRSGCSVSITHKSLFTMKSNRLSLFTTDILYGKISWLKGPWARP